MQLGAASGVIGVVIFIVLAAIEMLSPTNRAELYTQLMNTLQQQASRTPGPGAEEALNWLKTPSGLTFAIIFCLIVILLFSVTVSAVGGAISAALLRKSK
jgi:uncharacterized protein involved in cysteine biosynthesis